MLGNRLVDILDRFAVKWGTGRERVNRSCVTVRKLFGTFNYIMSQGVVVLELPRFRAFGHYAGWKVEGRTVLTIVIIRNF